jgi:hypothetical protein
MHDSRFAYSYGFGYEGVTTFAPRRRTAATVDALYPLWQQDVIEAEQMAGRRDKAGRFIRDPKTGQPRPELSRKELMHGVDRVQDQSPQQQRDEMRRRQLELNPPVSADTRTPTEVLADQYRARVEADRESKLTTNEKKLLESERAVAAEKAAKAAADAHAVVMASPAVHKVVEQFERLLSLAKFDETVPTSIYSELQHQNALLHKFGDATAATANLSKLSQQLFAGAVAQEQQLQAHVDRVQDRKAAFLMEEKPTLKAHAHKDVFGNEQMVLFYAGESKTIPVDQFNGKATAELLQTHFGVSP